MYDHIRWIISIAGIGALLAAAAWNEYLRTHFTIDTWVWFFAYFRIELLVGLGGSVVSASLLYIYSLPSPDYSRFAVKGLVSMD